LKPWSLAPRAGKAHEPTSLWTKLTGLRTVPGLGLLTTAVTGSTNAAIVDRSGILLNYGPQFRYLELSSTSSSLKGIATHWALIFGGFLLLVPPFRWLVKKFIYAPGQGPTRDSVVNDSVEYRAIGQPDAVGSKKAWGKLTFRGSMYDFTGILLAIGAEVLARGEKGEGTAASRSGGGFCTPAMLGERFIDGMKKGGMDVEVKTVDI
jgi:short subunit dehydrogenase-like uncharacterized protein